jgi:hypothetical protein
VLANALQFNALWGVATNGSQRGRMNMIAHDVTAGRICISYESSGTAAMIGFLGAAAVLRQVVGAAAPAGGTGIAAGGWSSAANRDIAIATLNSIRTAGINLGLWA